MRPILSLLSGILIAISLGHSAWADDLDIAQLDLSGRVAETWKLDGQTQCRWDKNDLVVTFEDGRKRELKKFTARMPGMKRLLKNPSLTIELTGGAMDTPSLFALQTATNLAWGIPEERPGYYWVTPKCQVTAKQVPEGLELTLACQGLVSENRRMSGIMNLEIPAKDSGTHLLCPTK